MGSLRANNLSFIDFKKSHIIPLVILAITTLVTFSNSFHNEFLMDDNEVIKESFFSSYQFLNFKAFQNRELLFRPLTYFFFGVHYAFFEDVGYKYHIVNLFWFYLSVITFYLVLYKIFYDKNLAFLAALFYSVHPFNGVLVNYKSAIGAVFLVFALNMSMLKFLAYLDRGRRLWDFCMGLMWFFIALMSYELALMYPLLLVLVLLCREKKDWKGSLLVMGGVLSVLFAYVLFCLHYSILFSQLLSESRTFHLVPTIYVGLFAKLVFWYVQQLLTMSSIVLVWNADIAIGQVWLWIGLLFSAFFLIVLNFYYRKHLPRAAFGLAWMILGFFPVVMACFARSDMGFIIEPHWLVYSSFGFFISFAAILLFLKQKLNQRLWLALVLCLMVACILKSWSYNSLWKNAVEYCSYWKRVVPNIVHARLWLGEAYVLQGKYEQAYLVFYEAIQSEKFKNFPALYAQLGACSYHMKQYDRSLEYFRKVISLNVNYADIQYYIGLNELALGRRDLARKAFQKAIQMDPALIEAQRKLLAL